jgi:ATP-dependent helicase HrpA
MKLRAERARKNPAKDAERAAQLAPFVKAVAAVYDRRSRPEPKDGGHRPPLQNEAAADTFRWLVEEFRVSLFAQELGTAEPVSAVKLERALSALGGEMKPARVEAPSAPKPIVAAPVGVAEKKAPLKNLGALDKLFQR